MVGRLERLSRAEPEAGCGWDGDEDDRLMRETDCKALRRELRRNSKREWKKLRILLAPAEVVVVLVEVEDGASGERRVVEAILWKRPRPSTALHCSPSPQK
jgi:hypothetical protein